MFASCSKGCLLEGNSLWWTNKYHYVFTVSPHSFWRTSMITAIALNSNIFWKFCSSWVNYHNYSSVNIYALDVTNYYISITKAPKDWHLITSSPSVSLSQLPPLLLGNLNPIVKTKGLLSISKSSTQALPEVIPIFRARNSEHF